MGRIIENLKAKIKKKLDKNWKPGPFPFQNPELTIEERVDDLISRMYLKEKAKQLTSRSASIARLGVPKYHWWNECLHGVGRAGLATMFPQSIGLGATFDPTIIHEMTKAISDEARATHHNAIKEGNERKQYFGLTFWSPNVNLFRDPRWGRGQETYGEDPYLMAEMGVQFVKGLQGEDEKLVVTPKDYVVHRGPD